jgi:signal transduction histidine kinase
MVADYIAPLFAWLHCTYLVTANLSFIGRNSPIWAAPVAAIVLDLVTIVVGLSNVQSGLYLFVVAVSLLSLWTSVVLLHMPHVGRFLCALFVFRAIIIPWRPFLLDSPYLLQYSILSFVTAFLAAMALLLASLMRSRVALLETHAGLRVANRELEEAKAHLMERNDILDSQSRKLERLSGDYMTALGRAEIANRAKDSFIANINHEFRTPLNAVIGFAELAGIEAGRTGQARLAEYVGHIDEGGKSLLKMIERILEYVEVDVGNRRIEKDSFDPTATIRGEIAAFQKLLDLKQVSVVFDADGAPALWAGDLRAFKVVTLEVFSNAVKFAPDRSAITISLIETSQGLSISFADLGPGLPNEALMAVGERFGVHEPVLSRGGLVQGLGLGLSLVKRTVELLDGAFSIRTNVPSGTIATIVFPRVEQSLLSRPGADQVRSG